MANRFADVINVKDFGAVGDGITDDTAALQAFFNAGKNLHLPTGTYRYNYLQFNTPFTMTGDGVLFYSGAAPASGKTTSIEINAPFQAESLRIRSSGIGEVAYDLIQANSSEISIGLLEMKADVQRNLTGGTTFFGSNIYIGRVVTVNVARPIAFQPPTGTTAVRDNIHLGSLVANNYIRGLAFSYANNWSVGSMHVKTRWDGAVLTPGYNGVLLQVCNNWIMGDLYIADAIEHSFRIGGDGDTKNFSIGQITSVNSGGCAMKFNVTTGYLAKDGQVGHLIGINTGQGSAAGNKEVTRLTRVENINIGLIAGYVWVSTALALQDIKNVHIGVICAENIAARVIVTRVDYDASTGDVDGLYVGNVTAYMQEGARAAYGFSYAQNSRKIGNIVIENSFVTGFSHFLCDAHEANIYSAPILIRARSLSTAPNGGVENVTNTILFQLDYTRGASTYKGSAFNYSNTAENTYAQTQFVNSGSVTSDEKAAFFLRSNATAALNSYGAGLGFSRLASERRGAAITTKQTGGSEQNIGLAFLCGSNNTATDQLIERMVLKHNGTLWIDLQTFASNAAAITGGLVAGETYKTSTGEIRIVV